MDTIMDHVDHFHYVQSRICKRKKKFHTSEVTKELEQGKKKKTYSLSCFTCAKQRQTFRAVVTNLFEPKFPTSALLTGKLY